MKPKKDKVKVRELSSTSEDASASKKSSPAKRSKKENNFLDALEAMEVDDNEAHSVTDCNSLPVKNLINNSMIKI